jgi:hypothetical protein
MVLAGINILSDTNPEPSSRYPNLTLLLRIFKSFFSTYFTPPPLSAIFFIFPRIGIVRQQPIVRGGGGVEGCGISKTQANTPPPVSHLKLR